jgi:TPR repeat protein
MSRRGWPVLLLLGVFGCVQPPRPEPPVRAAQHASTSAAEAADERACQDRGNARSCGRAAELYMMGRGHHGFDPATSFRYAARGCEGGDGLACAVLGQHYENGIGAPWSPQRAVAIYDRSCSAGSGLGCFQLAEMYFRGHGVEPGGPKAESYRERARTLWLAACQGDDPRACAFAAALPAPRREPDVPVPTALELDQRACDRGIARGCVDLLVARHLHDTGQLAAGLTDLDRLCRADEPTACEELAWIYRGYDANGHSKDAAWAAELTKRSCELGDAEACVLFGISYEMGAGTPKNQAMKWRYFELGCDRGAGHGCLFRAQDAVTVPGQQREMMSFAQRGCQMGNGAACDLLSMSYLVAHDDTAALRWATEACRLGFSSGCERLVEHDVELPRIQTDQKRHFYHKACDAKHQSACQQLSKLVENDRAMVQAALDAVAKQDVAAFAKLAPYDVDVRGLWFNSPDCTKQFSGVLLLSAAQQPAFLRCLMTLGMHVEPPSLSTKTWSLVYDPGVTLVFRVQDGVLDGIWAPPSANSEPVAAPLDPDVLMSHRITGTHLIEPDQAVRDAVARAPGRRAFVELSVCIDPAGKPEVRTLSHSSEDSYLQAVERTAAAWTFTPFQVHGQPTRVCALDRFTYPDQEWEGFRQPPLLLIRVAGPYPGVGAAPASVSPITLDAYRIAGNKNLVPDDRAKTTIARAGSPKVVGTFKVCLTDRGRIASVTLLKSTGLYSYDRRIERGIREWRYRPFLVNDVPAPVCTAVTFIYSQS